MTQLCTRCNQYKTQDQYHPGKWGKAGHYCRLCNAEYKADWKIRRGMVKTQGCTPPPRKPREISTGYRAVHKRVQSVRGKATEYMCACGVQAEEWAYDHTDPNPMHGTTPRGRPAVYSLDVAQYTPMCRPCHARFDYGRNTTVDLSHR